MHGSSRASSPRTGWKWTAGAAAQRSTRARYATLHQALLAGLLGNVGARRTTTSTTSARAACASTCIRARAWRRRAPRWLLAAELVETTRLYARCAARVEPDWIEEVGGRPRDPRLLRAALGRAARRGRRQRAGAAVRPDAGRAPAGVRSARIDPALARDVFIREALVPGALRHARRVPRAQPARWSPRSPSSSTRRGGRTCWSTTESIAAFYAERIPEGICTLVAFERWREQRGEGAIRAACSSTREA